MMLEKFRKSPIGKQIIKPFVISIFAMSTFSIFLYANANQHEKDTVQSSLPNIILVMTDDQGYGDFGHNNNPIVQTPVIDQLANKSIRFTDFHVDPTCSPTRAALMSGQYSLRAGVWHTVMGRHILSDKINTLPEVLKDAGYKTGMVGKWHLGDNYPFRPQDQGFDHVLMHGAGGVGQTPDYWGNTQFNDTYFLNGTPKKYNGYATDIWFDEAIDFIDKNANKADPFFLYLVTNAPHAPFRAPEKYIQPYRDLGVPETLALFYGMITSIDDNMGKLRKAMQDNNIVDNTIFIFMTDNGSVMGVQSKKLVSDETRSIIEKKLGQKIPSLNYDMRGAKNSSYEGGHRVPFYISWPNGGLIEPGSIDGLSAHFDVMPTLLDLIGVDTSTLDTDGISFKSALKQGTELPDRVLTVTTQRVLNPDPNRPYAVMQGKWRYVKASGNKDALELFDLSKDPSQTENVKDKYPEVANNMAKQYQQWWQYTTAKGLDTTRAIIGSTHENPSRLTSHDWLAPNTKQVGHTTGFGDDKWAKKGWLGKEENFQISPWKVKTAAKGLYQFTVLFHDKPANKVIPRQYAHLTINGQPYVKKLAKGATRVSFELPLEKQNLDIKAWFSDSKNNSDKSLAAFFIYAKRI
ncbi:arylsulfatase [Thalassotalea psychrophila]|uniref:Arylsulfatase n=1 Tax=Thalassotalea psychrophila TaxID=3065647 RepID=A0ABY9TVK2_9GAMM|nr:arylsulfatase [Colwelliaceae bacterium SQ149]